MTRSHKRTSMGPSRSCWNGTASALQLEEITSKGTRVSCVYYLSTKAPIWKKSENVFNDPRIYQNILLIFQKIVAHFLKKYTRCFQKWDVQSVSEKLISFRNLITWSILFSIRVIAFTFGPMPMGNVWFPLLPYLGVK